MIYFISGHRDVTPEEFDEHYVPKLSAALLEQEATFVVGDFEGVDIMAQKWLKDRNNENVIVFHMFTSPRQNAGFPTIGGFTSDEHRDSTMTSASDFDIAWVRPGKEKSGTAINLRRRRLCKEE